MPVLRNCCFFLDLKVGTMIIGVICLISSIMNTLMWGIASLMIGWMAGGANAVEDGFKSGPPTSSGTGGGFSGFPEDDGDEEYADVKDVIKPDPMGELVTSISNNLDTFKIVAFCLLAYSLLLLIAASMLIHGIRRNRRGLLAPWIILECGKTLIFLIGSITLFAYFGGNEVIIYTGLSFFAAVGLEIYFILVVVSQYQALGIIRMHDEIAIDMK